jgi:hypothetical protein
LLPSDPYTPTSATGVSTTGSYPIPIFEYILDCENVALMPQLFKDALSLYMAAYGAPSIPGIGQVDLREKNLVLGHQALQLAGAQNLNESFITPEKRSLIEKAANGEGMRFPISAVNNYVAANYNP